MGPGFGDEAHCAGRSRYFWPAGGDAGDGVVAGEDGVGVAEGAGEGVAEGAGLVEGPCPVVVEGVVLVLVVFCGHMPKAKARTTTTTTAAAIQPQADDPLRSSE